MSFTGHLDGVQGAPGVYGYHTLTQTFNIGPSLIAVGNTRTHRTQIYYNGQLRYDWPISSGRPGDDTPDGSYLTIEKENPVLMTGPGYSLEVPWSVRFTFSGDYYHDAYWSVGEQGFENVSHGCVNLSPADAETYYNLAVPGDPITITGSPKSGAWDNGWTEWFLSWPQYLKGSATGQAVMAGPDGSTFVDPSTLPPDVATAPLQTSPAGNANLQVAAAGLLPLDRLEQRLEVPLAEPLGPVPLDQLEEHRRPVLHRLGEDLQQVAVLVPVGQDAQCTQLIERNPGLAHPRAERVVVAARGGQELHARRGHGPDAGHDVVGGQRDVLHPGPAEELQVLIDLRLALAGRPRSAGTSPSGCRPRPPCSSARSTRWRCRRRRTPSCW